MFWILRTKHFVMAIGCLAVGGLVVSANAEEKSQETVTKTSNWPVKFTVQEAKPAVTQQKYEIKQPFYPALTIREQHIQTALNANTKCDFPDVPLSKALNSLQSQHGINMFLSGLALEEEGLTADEPINVSLSGIPFKSALDIILEPLSLTYVVDGEVLKITTQEEADRTFKVRIYPVGDLCKTPDDYQALESVIEKTCVLTSRSRSKYSPVSDLVLGAPGKKRVPTVSVNTSISVVPQCKALVVNDTDRVHEKIVGLLSQLRQVRKDQAVPSVK
ncbi:hypothetical protein [uncultured Gimesia sp.]|uniref:hypothetical protein n=1 Tax=uncultured Gimesia sp. TaxID=1678688 RepID=UPI0030DC8C1B